MGNRGGYESQNNKGNQENIICPVMCFIQITTSSTASLTTKPANSPIITAISSCTIVLLRKLFSYIFFQLNDEYPEKVCCIGMLFHSLNKDRKIKIECRMKNRKRRETSRSPSYEIFLPYANTLIK